MVTSSMLPLWPSRIIQKSNKFGLERCFLGVVNLAQTTCVGMLLRNIGLLEADEDKIRKIRPKGTQVRMLYVPREPIRP